MRAGRAVSSCVALATLLFATTAIADDKSKPAVPTPSQAAATSGASSGFGAMPAAPGEQVDAPNRKIGPSYLWDGGAIPFIWAPIAARLVLDNYTTPTTKPRFFSSSEGGAEKADWEIPGWAVSSLAGVSALGMIASGSDATSYHVKGLAESLSTGIVVTAAVKVVVGRHRPDWVEGGTPGSRRSFPSGHATQAFAIATYTGLFLRQHVFAKYRGDRTLPWWEAATYGGLALGASALAGERVIHNRHHLSDVVIGGLLGTASSSLFYWYQESRYDRHTAEDQKKQLAITPAQGGRGATVGMSFVW